MKQKITKYLIALALMLMPTLMFAQYTDTATGVTYTLSGTDGTDATIIGSVVTTGTLIIPNTVSDGLGHDGKVVVIRNVAFINNQFQNDYSGGGLDLSQCTSLTTIGDHAFYMCKFNGELKLPPSLTTIENMAFGWCGGFTGDIDLSLCVNLQRIGGAAFMGCRGFDGELKLPMSSPSFTTIGTGAFYNCLGLSNKLLVIPASVISMGDDYANFNNSGDGATYYGVFEGCASLRGDIVVESAKTIYGNMFKDCSNLKSITFKSPTIDLFDPFGLLLSSLLNYYGINAVVSSFFSGANNLEYIDLSACTLATAHHDFNLSRDYSYLKSDLESIGFGDLADLVHNCAAHTVIYMPKGTPAELIPNEPNFVNSDDMTCQWFSLTDQADYFIPHAFTATKATYDNYAKDAATYDGSNLRMLTNNLTPLGKYSYAKTLYLPYDFTLPAGMVGYTLVNYTDYSSSFNGPSLGFKSVDSGKFSANTPYIVRFEDNTCPDAPLPSATGVEIHKSIVGVNHVIDGVTLPAPNEGSTVQTTTDGNWTLFGTTEDVDNATASTWNAYNLSNNYWGHVEASTPSGYIGHMRCFIVSKPGTDVTSAKAIFNGIPDTDTPAGIGGITSDEPSNNVETRIYNIGGQYMGKDINALPKGMYIVNGKKQIKK